MTGSIAETQAAARALYAEAAPLQRLLAIGRPRICPLHELTEIVPDGCRTALDIGCGNGLFLNLLAHQKRIEQGIGIDVSSQALIAARQAADVLPATAHVQFQQHDLDAGLPPGTFDLVCMIDVLHHVTPSLQLDALRDAAARVRPGAWLLYKDMASRPRWQAWANRVHDLVLARQWINYRSIDEVRATLEGVGLEVVHDAACSMLWYRHETLLCQRPAMHGASPA